MRRTTRSRSTSASTSESWRRHRVSPRRARGYDAAQPDRGATRGSRPIEEHRMKRHLCAAAAALLLCRRRRERADDAQRRHVGRRRRPARSAPRDDDAGQAADLVDVQRPGPLQARLGEPRDARARSRRELGEHARQADLDLQPAQGRQVPRRLRRAHRRRRRLLAQARRRLEDLVVLGRLRVDRHGRGGRPADGARQAEEGGAVLPRPRHQLPRRQRRQQEGGREARRQLPPQADRHRPVHVRGVQAEPERRASSPTRSISAARRRSIASSTT